MGFAPGPSGNHHAIDRSAIPSLHAAATTHTGGARRASPSWSPSRVCTANPHGPGWGIVRTSPDPETVLRGPTRGRVTLRWAHGDGRRHPSLTTRRTYAGACTARSSSPARLKGGQRPQAVRPAGPVGIDYGRRLATACTRPVCRIQPTGPEQASPRRREDSPRSSRPLPQPSGERGPGGLPRGCPRRRSPRASPNRLAMLAIFGNNRRFPA